MAPDDGGMTSPAALPRGSWADTLKRTLREFQDDKLQHWAAALTYYAVLSIFPALLVMVSLRRALRRSRAGHEGAHRHGLRARPGVGREHVPGPDRVDHRATAAAPGSCSSSAIAGALWAASGYVSAFTDAANTIYEVDEGRPFWKLKPIQLLITLVLILMAAIGRARARAQRPDRRRARAARSASPTPR